MKIVKQLRVYHLDFQQLEASTEEEKQTAAFRYPPLKKGPISAQFGHFSKIQFFNWVEKAVLLHHLTCKSTPDNEILHDFME